MIDQRRGQHGPEFTDRRVRLHTAGGQQFGQPHGGLGDRSGVPGEQGRRHRVQGLGQCLARDGAQRGHRGAGRRAGRHRPLPPDAVEQPWLIEVEGALFARGRGGQRRRRRHHGGQGGDDVPGCPGVGRPRGSSQCGRPEFVGAQGRAADHDGHPGRGGGLDEPAGGGQRAEHRAADRHRVRPEILDVPAQPHRRRRRPQLGRPPPVGPQHAGDDRGRQPVPFAFRAGHDHVTGGDRQLVQPPRDDVGGRHRHRGRGVFLRDRPFAALPAFTDRALHGRHHPGQHVRRRHPVVQQTLDQPGDGGPVVGRQGVLVVLPRFPQRCQRTHVTATIAMSSCGRPSRYSMTSCSTASHTTSGAAPAYAGSRACSRAIPY